MLASAIVGAVALVCALAPSAVAQQPNVASLQAQVNKLSASLKSADSAIKRLEAKLAKMEKDQSEDIEDLRKDEEDDDKGVASLEKRVAALERSKGDAKGESSGSDPKSSVVRAPFEVHDTDGRVIFRVTGGKSPRLMIGEEKGGQVEMGTGTAGGGTLRVRDATNTDRALIIATAEFGQFRALGKAHSVVMTAGDAEGAMVSLFKGDTPSARLRSGNDGYGGMLLSDPSGTPMVVAGTIASSKGYVGTVRVGPGQRPNISQISSITGVR
jgi:hypothetical protein